MSSAVLYGLQESAQLLLIRGKSYAIYVITYFLLEELVISMLNIVKKARNELARRRNELSTVFDINYYVKPA